MNQAFIRSCCLVCLIIPSFSSVFLSLSAAQTAATVNKKEESLKYDAHLDSKKPKTVIVIVDLSLLDSSKSVTNLLVPVEFVDEHGNTLGKREFKFVDAETHDPALRGGQKYSRRFEYDDTTLPHVAMVKPLPSSALIITEIDAFERNREKAHNH
jgi:hypothetical protein